MEAVKQLVEKSLENDLSAFEQLINIYQGRVYTLSYQLTNSYADAQDLTQEVFIKAYYSLKGFRNEADFGTWLHKITVNMWLNTKRKRSIQNAVSLNEPISDGENEVYRDLAATDGDPEQSLESKEFNGLVRRALGELSREYQAVVILREIEGYSYEEMSLIMNCSLGTVKSRLNRARQVLKQQVIKLAKESGYVIPGTRKNRVTEEV
ncbi:MAG TPA: RNA polymerase subunit sigma-24 [Desulfotomaculum sp.]|nr:MAG: RNA polymerase sigma factor [Desulfotomaculum sp. 46_80]HAG11770.1 RNA polymerase subunit sigma-24 [Desulfotomaculum sp.]HBY03809.1 RNA polymerase subunit sigma-24 [Desulfotomaculum sp.]